MEKRWEATYSSNWSALTVLAGKVVIKRAAVVLEEEELRIIRDGGEEERYALDGARVSYSRWVYYPNAGCAGTISTLEVDGKSLRIGGETLLPDHRLSPRSGVTMDMVLTGPDFLDLISGFDELGLDDRAHRSGSPYRDDRTVQHDEYTLQLAKSPWSGAWKVPVIAISAILGLMMLVGAASTLGDLSGDTLIYVVTALGILFAVVPFFAARWIKQRSPSRLVIAGRELRLVTPSGQPLVRAKVDGVKAEPLLYATAGTPSYSYAALKLSFTDRDPLTIGSYDTRTWWDSPIENTSAPKYALGLAEFQALVSCFGLSESLRFDRTRWQTEIE